MKRIAFVIIALSLAFITKAQTEIPYSHIIIKPSWVNPAYIGMDKGLSLDLAYKKEWQGFAGAPKTMGFNLHNSFDQLKFGVGIDGHFESLGRRNKSRIALNLNTSVNLAENTQLMFGLFGGVDILRVKSFYDIQEIDLDLYSNTMFDQEGFTGGFGINMRHKQLQVGGAFHMTTVKNGTNARSFFLHGDYKWTVAPDWMVKPMAMYRNSNYGDDYTEVGVMGYFKEMAGLGVTYRFDRKVGIFAEIGILQYVSVLYNYDIYTGGLTDLKGTHEFGLSLNTDIFKK